MAHPKADTRALSGHALHSIRLIADKLIQDQDDAVALRILLLQCLYSLRNPGQLEDHIRHNALFREFIGVVDQPWTYEEYRGRIDSLIRTGAADDFLDRITDALPTTPLDRSVLAGPVQMPAFIRRWGGEAALAFVLMILLLVQLKWLITYPMEFDAGYNATVSKNLAGGHGYVSLYPSLFPYGVMTRVRAFAPEITTGPAVLVPAALMIKVFGNGYWVPGLSVILQSLALLLAVYGVLKTDPYWRRRAALAVAIAVVLSVPFIYQIRIGGLGTLFMLLGEVPASLFILLGTALLLGTTPPAAITRRHYIGVGFLAAAYLSKDLALLPAGCALAVFAILASRGRLSDWRRLARSLSPLLIFPLLVLLKELWRIVAIGDFALYLTARRQAAEYFARAGSGVDAFRNAPDKIGHILSLLGQHWKVFAESFPGAMAAPLLMAFLLLAFAVAAWRLWRAIVRCRDRRSILPATLVFGFAPVLLWWFAVSELMLGRHIVVAVIPFFAGVSLFLVSVPAQVRPWLVASVLVVLLTSYAQPLMSIGNDLAEYSRGLKSGPIVQKQQELVRLIAALKTPKRTFVVCGAEMMPEIEYLLPGYGNFENCIGWRNPDPSGNMVFVVRRIDWKSDPGFARIHELCPKSMYNQPTFAQYGYFVDQCPPGFQGF